MGQVRDIMFDSVYIKSKSRIVNNKCIHNSESVNWRADWSKFCNRSYAQVVKQNTQPRLQSQKCIRSSHTLERSVRPKIPFPGAKSLIRERDSTKFKVTNPVPHQTPK